VSEYTEVEQPFLHQLQSLGWEIIDQGQEIPFDPSKSLRTGFRQWLLPGVYFDRFSAWHFGSSQLITPASSSMPFRYQ